MQKQVQRKRGDLKNHFGDDDLEIEVNSDSRDKEWRNYTCQRQTMFKDEVDDNDSFQAKGSRTQIRSWELHKVKKGDHVGWHRPCSIYWHHAIVADIDLEYRRILVIHFSKVGDSMQIVKEWIYIEKQKGEMFLFEYLSDIQKNNSTYRVLMRANNLVGREGYRLFKNNCEHFATYCKTGEKESVQTRWVSKNLRNSCITSFTKVAVAEGLERLGKGTDRLGAGIVCGLEFAHCAYDIYRLRRNRNRGNMSERDFRVSTTQRISEGVFGAAGAVYGSIVGGRVGGRVGGNMGGYIGGCIGSYIPVIGTAVGTVVGTAVGTAVGRFVGSVVGGVIGSLAGKTVGSFLGGWFGRKFW